MKFSFSIEHAHNDRMKPLLTCPARSWGFRPIQTPTLGVHSQPGDAALQPREGDGLRRWHAAWGRGQPQLGGDRDQVGERCYGYLTITRP